ncbi:hypothetical protein SAMN05660489_03703 [Pseudomonas sp. LAMO17WK12:I10]|uniref:hypothetical protein n=1 Tax=unclassified Pseudomonas TaxID=196821 RepID=UPI000BDA407A|nr:MULTISPECIES: hypothetical protein [unclassified Pseudomonas]PXX63817.1 hypothetical protein H160_03921 [Pseudomonas sp. LAMO17WK12:I9]SNY39950.1 hypothetical protein SAMN05660489_03703 [Pseudomonas sp. LAMO17WK12:I10]
MHTNQRYMLTLKDLFIMSGGAICWAEAEVAFLDGDAEVDRIKLSGKVGPGGFGYRRSYEGKPGLAAKLVTGVGQITFEMI